jgi:hypothetical protein
MERIPRPEPQAAYSEKHPVFAGSWVDRVSNGDRIEIGGSNSISPERLDIRIEADFDVFRARCATQS